MKKILISLFFTALLLSACATPQSSKDDPGPVEVFAVLAEKDDYKALGMTDLHVDYIDNARLREALESLGWPAENIIELRDFTRDDLEMELNWLEKKADANDLVFFYVTGHGSYLRDIVRWDSFFPDEWDEIPSLNKVLVVDSCQAAKYTNQLKVGGGLVIAAVDKDEYGWKGLEEEGLPIVGGVFTYYFAEALLDPAADSNQDGQVSVQEAALAAEVKQRKYMHDEVFAVPQFLEMYHEISVDPENDPTFPDVIMTDSLGEELFLEIISQ